MAEARNPFTGCLQPILVPRSIRSDHDSIGNSLDGIAPGQIVEGDIFRVYSRTLAEKLEIGETAKVIVDTDEDLYNNEVTEFTVGISQGGFFRTHGGSGLYAGRRWDDLLHTGGRQFLVGQPERLW